MHTMGGARSKEVDSKALFQKEDPPHICNSIATMEDEIFCEFRLRLGHDITMSNYWRMKFILAKSMSKR